MTKLISLNKFESTIQSIIGTVKDLNSIENKLRKEEVVYVVEYNKINFKEVKENLKKIKNLFEKGD